MDVQAPAAVPTSAIPPLKWPVGTVCSVASPGPCVDTGVRQRQLVISRGGDELHEGHAARRDSVREATGDVPVEPRG